MNALESVSLVHIIIVILLLLCERMKSCDGALYSQGKGDVDNDGNNNNNGNAREETIISQVEYAMKGIDKQGSSLLAYHNRNCAILLCWSPKTLLSSSSAIQNIGGEIVNRKLMKLSKYSGVGVVGLPSDAYMVTNELFAMHNEYQYQYDDEPCVERIVRNIGRYIHEYTLSPVVRPLGARICSISYDLRKERAQIFDTDCLGNVWACRVSSMGPLSQAFMRNLNPISGAKETQSLDEMVSIGIAAVIASISRPGNSDGDMPRSIIDTSSSTKDCQESSSNVGVVGYWDSEYRLPLSHGFLEGALVDKQGFRRLSKRSLFNSVLSLKLIPSQPSSYVGKV